MGEQSATETWKSHGESARPSCSAGQAGFGLVEVMISIILVAVMMTASAFGIMTAVSTSGDNQVRQRLQVALTSYSESLGQMPFPGGSCADRTPAAYNAEYQAWADHWTPPTGITVRVRDSGGVEYWNRSAADFDSTCPTSDTGAHRLTIEARKGSMAVSGQIVKRNPDAQP